MAFTAARVTSLSDTDRDRLINDSLEKINAGSTFPFKEGLTDDQIYTFWVSRYGERIITNPINRNLEILFIP